MVPAYRFVPLTARDRIEVPMRPELTSVQDVPLFGERRIPPLVAANRIVSQIAKSQTEVRGNKPELTTAQLVPLFVERKIPLSVPANRFVSLTKRLYTSIRCGKPESTEVQL